MQDKKFRFWIIVTLISLGVFILLSSDVFGLSVADPGNVSRFMNISWVNASANLYYNVSVQNVDTSTITFIANASSNFSIINEGAQSFDGLDNAFDGSDASFANSSTSTSLNSYLGHNFFAYQYVQYVRVKAYIYQGSSSTSSSIIIQTFNGSTWNNIYSWIDSGGGGHGNTNFDVNVTVDANIKGLRVYLYGECNRDWVGRVYDVSYYAPVNELRNLDTFVYSLPIGLYKVLVNGSVESANSSVFNLTRNALLNVSVVSNFGSSLNFSANLSGDVKSGASSVLFDVVNGQYYNLTINASNYNPNSSMFIISSYGTSFRNYSLSPYNSLNITVRDESSGGLLFTPNTSISLVSDGGLVSSDSFNGSKLFSGLTTDFYTLTFSRTGYSSRRYYVDVYDGSFQYVNVYLNNGSSILFNFKTSTGSALSGVTFSVYTTVGGSSVLVESVSSDITGNAQVSLESGKYYSFVASKSGYNSYAFILNPVLYSSYDVVLTPSTIGNVVIPSATVSFSPSSFFRFQNVNFNMQFLSQYNSLSSYGYNVSYGSNVVGGIGSNAHGESFVESFSLADISYGDEVSVYYWYNLSNGVNYSRLVSYPIVYSLSNRTWATMGNNINQSTGQDATTGLFVGDRVLIVTIMSVVLFGVGWLAWGATGGLVLVVMNILFFLVNGFVPKPLYYVVLFFVVIYIISRGSDS